MLWTIFFLVLILIFLFIWTRISIGRFNRDGDTDLHSNNFSSASDHYQRALKLLPGKSLKVQLLLKLGFLDNARGAKINPDTRNFLNALKISPSIGLNDLNTLASDLRFSLSQNIIDAFTFAKKEAVIQSLVHHLGGRKYLYYATITPDQSKNPFSLSLFRSDMNIDRKETSSGRDPRFSISITNSDTDHLPLEIMIQFLAVVPFSFKPNSDANLAFNKVLFQKQIIDIINGELSAPLRKELIRDISFIVEKTISTLTQFYSNHPATRESPIIITNKIPFRLMYLEHHSEMGATYFIARKYQWHTNAGYITYSYSLPLQTITGKAGKRPIQPNYFPRVEPHDIDISMIFPVFESPGRSTDFPR